MCLNVFLIIIDPISYHYQYCYFFHLNLLNAIMFIFYYVFNYFKIIELTIFKFLYFNFLWFFPHLHYKEYMNYHYQDFYYYCLNYPIFLPSYMLSFYNFLQ